MMSAAANAFALLLILFGFSTSRRFDRWRPAVILLSGAIAALCVVIAWDGVGTPRRYRSDEGLTTAVLCFLGLISATVVTLMAGAWDIRNWLQRRVPIASGVVSSSSQPESFATHRSPASTSATAEVPLATAMPSFEPLRSAEGPTKPSAWSGSADEELQDIAAQSEIDGPAVALLLAGITVAVGHFIAVVAILDSSAHSRWFRPDEFYVGWLSVCVLQGAVMAFGGLQFYRRRSLTWSRIGAITACLPMGPAVLLSAIAGIYAHRTLGRESVRQAFFRETRRLRRRRQTEPRLSGKAAFGTIWALSSLLFQLLLTVSLFAFRKTQADASASPLSGIPVIQLIPLTLVALTPALSTVVGVLAIRDIKRSRGMLKGFGMAFFSVVCFPLLIFNAIILSRLMPAVDYLLSDLSPPLTQAISTILGLGMIVLNILLLWYVWRKLKPQAELTAVVQSTADSDS